MNGKALFGFAKWGAVLVTTLLFLTVTAFYIIPILAADFTVGVSPSSGVEAGSASQLLNFTINNVDPTENITIVNITLPNGFSFITDTNGTSASGTSFTSNSVNVTWSNTTASGFVENGTEEHFWFNASVPNEPNTYNFTITTMDTAGVANSTNVSVTVTDTTPPTDIVTVPPTLDNGSYTDKSWFYVNVTVAELNPDTCQLELYNGTLANYTMTRNGNNCYFNATGQPDGDWSYSVWANDTSGNPGWNGTWSITVDTADPTTSDDYANNDTWVNSDQTITLTPSDPAPSSGIDWTRYCQISGCDPSTGTDYTTPVPITTEGTSYFRYASSDNAGNVQPTQHLIVKIDKTEPSPTLVSPTLPDGQITLDNWVYVNVTSSDNLNTSACLLEWDDGSPANDSMNIVGSGTDVVCWLNETGLSDAIYSYKVYARDDVGNWNVTESRSVTVTANLAYALTVNLSNILNNLPIPNALLKLVNCQNTNQTLASGSTNSIGQATLGISDLWNFSIHVKISENYINKTDDNGGKGYQLSINTTIAEEVYSLYEGSFNVTVVDSVNGRPVSNVNVSVYREDAGTEDQSDNYRCDNGVCTTDNTGNTLLVIPQGDSPPCGNYFVSIVDEVPNYLNKNTSIYTGPCVGNNKDVLAKIDGAQSISGYITDKYNTQIKVVGASVTMWNHSTPAKMFGWDDKYFYNGTTDGNGKYDIRMPSNLLCSEEWCRYDMKVEADNYVSTYSKGPNDIGYQYAQQIDLNLTGPLDVNGKIIELTNGEPVSGAEVSVYNESEGFSYVIYTDAQGDFSVKIRNNTGYSVKVSGAGYEDNITTPLQGSQSMGDITLRGKAHLVGKIVDMYKDQSDSDIPLSANINFNSGLYQTTSDANGDFSIFVRSGTTYSMSVSKDGYFTSTFPFSVEEDPTGSVSLGTKELAGKHQIYGTIYDSEPGAVYDKLADVDVLVHDSYHTYKVTSTYIGQYSVNISSVNNKYYLEFQRDGFDTKLLNNSGNNYTSFTGSKEMNTQLFGSTTVTGNVADEYSPPGSPIFVPDAMMLFRDHQTGDLPGDLHYNITSDSNGYFSINLGVRNNYDIEISKDGYNSRTFDNLGSGYVAGDDVSFNNVTSDYLRLRGTAHVFGVVRDNKSNEYVYNAVVTIYEKNSSQAKYRQSVNGSYEFWIDGDMHYGIEADAIDYPKKEDSNGPTGYNGDLELNITLKAQFHAILKDAENLDYDINNARVRLYHYYDQTYFGPDTTPQVFSLNETTLNVTVSCEESGTQELLYLDDINVTLIKTDGCLGYQETLGLCWRSQNTTNGTTLFDTFAAGTYDLTIDGSQIGCGIKSEPLTVDSSNAGTQINKSYALTESTLIIRVMDPIWFVDNTTGMLENANVTLHTIGPYTNATPDNLGQGWFRFHFVINGTNNVSAYDDYHYLNYTLFTHDVPGWTDQIDTPLILQPLPANFSIYLLNSTGYGVDDGVVVNITNQSGMLVDDAFFNSHYSDTYTLTTSGGGWANFTNIYSSVYWNISVNGTLQGYNHTYSNDSLIEAGNLSMINVSIRENTLLVHVYGLSGGSMVDVNASSVILWNGSVGSTVAKNGLGEDLNETTNDTGGIFFNRMIPRIYNVSINGTGFEPFETVVVLEINENYFNPVLNDTTPPYYDDAWMSPAGPNQGDVVRIYVHWVDNAILKQSILQLKYEDNSEENHTYKAFVIDDWSNFTLDPDYTTEHAGEDISWKVIARDSSNNWNTSMPWTQFHINDTEAPVVSVTHIPEPVVAGMEVVFQASVSDNHNISWVKIYVDYDDKSASGQECIPPNGSSMVCTWKSPGFDYETTHYYYAIAADDEGNQGRNPDAELNVTLPYTLLTGRSQGAAIYVGDVDPEKIYIFGGQEAGADVSREILGFQPRNSDNPALVTYMSDERRSFAVAYDNDNGDIYLFGGSNGATWLTSIERFVVSSESILDRSETIPDDQRNSPSAAYHRSGTYGYIYLFGGDNGTTEYSQSIWRYNITADSGGSIGNLPTDRSKTAAVYSQVNDKIYIIGGFNGTHDLADIIEYTPGESTAAVAASMPKALEGVSTSYHTKTQKIYIFGGYNFNDGVYSDEIYEFDPQTNITVVTNSTLPSPRAFTSAAFSAYDDKFYIFGGESGTNGTIKYDEIVKYDPTYGKSFTVLMKRGNLTIDVYADGSPVTECGGWPTVTLSHSGTLPNGKSFPPQTKDAENGQARFEYLYPELTYNYDVDGESQGYNNVSDSTYVDQDENNITVDLGITTLTINVTNSSGLSVDAHYVVFPQGGDPDTDQLTRCDGIQIEGDTGSDGLVTYTRVLPCTNCNLTVTKTGATPSWNSVLFSVVAGEDNYIHIDPPGDSASLGSTYPYYIDAIGDYNTLTINVTTNSSGTPTPISYVNITMLRDDGRAAGSNLTDAYGLTTIAVKDGVYNMSVKGEGRGYDSFLVVDLKIGKLAFANGTTENGQVLLVVDGQPMYTPLEPRTPSGGYGYYVRIETAGYGSYDSLESGIGIFQGTYFDDAAQNNNDVNNSFTLNMYGLSMINGTVTDIDCVYSNCRVPGVIVKLLSGVKPPGEDEDIRLRYLKTTNINGTFSLHVSPYTADSYWNNPINESYDLKTEKGGYVPYYTSAHGYPLGIELAKYQNFTPEPEPELTGSGYVSGYIYSHEEPPQKIGGADVKFVATTQPSANPNILPNSNYYSTVSANGTGYFSMAINPTYGPYKISVEKNQSTLLPTTMGPYNESKSDVIIYLYAQNHGSIQFYVLDEFGQGIQNANVTVTRTAFTPITKVTDQNGEAEIWSIGISNYNVTINASYLGYGNYQGQAVVNSGQETVVNVTLPATKINVTLVSDTGENVDNLTVSLRNASGLLSSINTANGSTVFAILVPDDYNITFSGYRSLVYYLDGATLSSNVTSVNITESEAGKTTNIAYVLNETRALVKLVDYNDSGLPNITVTISNVTDNVSATIYNTSSDENGHALFREILPAHNYSIIFNDSQLHSMGLIVPENYSISVTGGEDENTTNNITIVINDVQVRFNITNTTGDGIANVVILLLDENGSVARNAYNQTLNGTTGSDGMLIIHNVPNRTYEYLIDANQTGYGIWNGSVTVTIDDVSIVERANETALSPIKLTVYAFNSSGGLVKENVTVSVLYSNTLTKGADGENLTANITNTENSTEFTHLLVYPLDYTIEVTSPRYFSNSSTAGFELMNPSVTHKNLSFTLTERSLTIRVRYGGSELDEGANISLVNASDGSAVTGTNGSVIANKTNITDSTVFEYIPDGTYNITVNSAKYFNPAPLQFDTSEILDGVDSRTITFTTERRITVVVRNSTGNALEEGVNISIQDGSGNVLMGLDGSYLNESDITDSVDFTHIPDGTHYINITSDRYFSSIQAFNASDILLGIDTYNFTMSERTVYIYLRDSDLTTLDYGVNVSLTNSTGGQLNGTNGQPIDAQTDQTDTVIFNYVPDGINLIVNAVSNDYFSQNWTFNTTDLPTNNTHTFIMRTRTLTVNIYHLTRDVITESVTVSVLNETGDVAKNRTGQFVNGTTNTGSISFTGIEDGTYNISLQSANYTSKNVSFEPESGDNNQVDVYLLKKLHGYFNVTVLTSGSPLSGATVTLRYNGTTDVDSRDTGSDGIAVVETNTSVYGQNLTIKVSRSGYYDNETEQYDISDQEVKDVVVTLSATPPPPPGGKRGGYVGGPAVDSETQKLGDISANIAKSAKFSKSDTLNIEEIEVLTDQDASNVKITVKESGKPAGAADPISSAEGKVQKYLDITATNLPNSIISRVTISFKVSRSWVDNNGIDPTELFMFRYYGGAWNRLETTLILQDSKWYYYRSTSPGFSIFAIGGYKFKEKDMELVLSPLSIKGSECRTAYITVKNTGVSTLSNIHVEALETECCSIQPVKGIASLASGSQNTISVEVCASRTTERGTYEYSLAVVSGQLTDTVSSKIYVTESYLETLTKQIEELEDKLEKLNKTQLNETGLGYYNSALEKIDDSKDYLSRQDFDAAITLLGEAKEYYEKIQVSGPPAKGYLDMFLEWIMINYVLASATAAIIVFSLSFLFIKRKVLAKELPEMPEVPTGGEVVRAIKKAPDEVMDSIMGVVKELEAKVDEIDIDTLRERERKWYNKVKLQIENIKKSVEKGEFDKAKRNLNDAELFMKMLELNTASD